MRQVTIILCAAAAHGDLLVYEPFAAVTVWEGPAATIESEPEIIETTGEAAS